MIGIYGIDAKKRCVKINHTSNTKNYIKYNIQKGERQ